MTVAMYGLFLSTFFSEQFKIGNLGSSLMYKRIVAISVVIRKSAIFN